MLCETNRDNPLFLFLFTYIYIADRLLYFMDENCESCKDVAELLVNSSTVIYARENNSRILCTKNHIVFDGAV